MLRTWKSRKCIVVCGRGSLPGLEDHLGGRCAEEVLGDGVRIHAVSGVCKQRSGDK